MMALIGLFFPSVISLLLDKKIMKEKEYNAPEDIVKYVVYVLVNTLITMSMIVYVFKITDSLVTTFNSFPFFTKYLVISIFFAIIDPIIKEVICSHLRIKLERKDENAAKR